MVEELDQDLDIDDDNDDKGDAADKKKSGITSVGLKESIKNANTKSGESKTDDDDEVQLEDPSEDVKDDAEEGKNNKEANDSTETKLAGAKSAEEEKAEKAPKHDYSLMDMICQFLYEDTEPLPILCGYFTKIMD